MDTAHKKERLYGFIDALAAQLIEMADAIFDKPELGLQEFEASDRLATWLEACGFAVERGVGGLATAFRAVYRHGEGGPSIGLLCEYDALAGIGHACGHHFQGPAILGAAEAVRQLAEEIGHPFQLVVYGTPAEETSGGKIAMLENGCFQDIDVALMIHGGGETTTDIKSMANSGFSVRFRGQSAHAAIKPEEGRSALDALLLAFQGIEFLREHVRDEVRMHYTVIDAGGTPANVVPASAAGSFLLRSYNRSYLNSVVERFYDVMRGAALMTGTEVGIEHEKDVDNKIPVLRLNELLMENAGALEAPRIRPPREKTGSTDFGNVMHVLPGSCLRVAFVPEGTPSHSQTYVELGKSEAAHQALLLGAKVLAATTLELICERDLLAEIKKEFATALAAEQEGM